MRVLGLISGTSHDGIDAAAVDFGLDGATLTARLVGQATYPYDLSLRAQLMAALPPAWTTFAQVCELDTLIGQAFAAAAVDLAGRVGGVDAVCSHGQTVFHWVDAGSALGTLQLGQPAWIAEAVGVPVVADVRARDLAVGGQGAPLASFLDAMVLGRDRVGAALNLGGIANVTVASPSGVVAFDTGPANALIDAAVVVLGLHPGGYDDGGRIAASGRVDAELLDRLLSDPYYRLAPPKSTGKEVFHWDYLAYHLAGLGRPVEPADLIATLTELTVVTVAGGLELAGAGPVERLLVSGGGAHNPVILAGLRARLPDARIEPADAVGLPVDVKEAILMAVVGWCALHGVPATVPGGTGAREARILGSITPGRGPLRLPEPVSPPMLLAMAP